MSSTYAAEPPALLVLEDGRVHYGAQFGAAGQTLGEAVFCTAMTGYQETLTDPSYSRQIVVATAPQIGNTGWNDEDDESRGNKIWVAGYAVRNPTRRVSSWRATRGLDDELKAQGIVGISGIDTRAVVRHLRTFGSMRAGVFSGAVAADALTQEDGVDSLVQTVREQPPMTGLNLAGEVSTEQVYTIDPKGEVRATIVAVDLGIKTNTPRMFAARGMRVHVVPHTISFADVQALHPDGVFLSNGPGDPATANSEVAFTQEVLGAGIPLFGICFGNQILGRALGRGTYKMKFGHRGINIPVIDHRTGSVAITAQNHGFAIEGERGEKFQSPFGPAVVSHVCANDGSVEGLELVGSSNSDLPRAFSVQYHPEAAAGPHDAEYLFDRFAAVMGAK